MCVCQLLSHVPQPPHLHCSDLHAPTTQHKQWGTSAFTAAPSPPLLGVSRKGLRSHSLQQGGAPVGTLQLLLRTHQLPCDRLLDIRILQAGVEVWK